MGVTKYSKKTKQALKTIFKGDKVKIVDCWEAQLYSDKEFTVQTEPKQMDKTYYVWLNGIGYFDIAYLEKVS